MTNPALIVLISIAVILLFVALFLREDKKSINIRGIAIKDIFSGIFIMGGAGSFKTKGVLYDLLKIYLRKNINLFVYDHKGEEKIGGELLRTIRGILSEKEFSKTKYEYHIVDFNNPQFTTFINPLDPMYYKSDSEIRSFWLGLYDSVNGTNSAKKDGASEFYRGMSVSILTAITIVLHELFPNKATIPNVIRLFTDLNRQQLEYFTSKNNLAASQSRGFFALSGEQFSTVDGSIQNFLNTFQSPEVFWTMHKPEGEERLYFDVRTINDGNSNKIVILTNHSRNVKTYSPILAAIFETAIRFIAVQKRAPLQLILDEGAQLPVNRFSDIPSTLRSYKIGTNYIIQDFSVAYERIGKEATHAIISNLSAQFIGKINDADTAKKLESAMEEVEKNRYTKKIGLATGGTFTKQERKKFKANDFFKLKNGNFICVSGGVSKKVGFNKQIFYKGRFVPEVVTKRELEMDIPLMDFQVIKNHYHSFFSENYVLNTFFEGDEKVAELGLNKNEISLF